MDALSQVIDGVLFLRTLPTNPKKKERKIKE
jgi:hypothetical protein